MNKKRIGIIGGSGLYKMEGLQGIKRIELKTPFGAPSDEYITGSLGGRDVAFLPRHGLGHRLLPGEINYRANIYGFKELGVEWLIGIGAVGSLKEELKPTHIVLPEQFFDRSKANRKSTFFGDGIVAHVNFAQPVCSALLEILYQAGLECGATIHKGGTYVNMEGPAFSTLAESNIYRQWGLDVIGMTNLTEAKLAREAEICYATLAAVTDYDCWHGEEEVNVETILKNMAKNEEVTKRLIKTGITRIPEERNCGCKDALKNAIVTSPDMIPPEVREKLKPLVGKYLKK